MKIYEKRETTTIQKTLIKVVYDVCKKEIDVDDGSYYDVTTGHYDWGNDSGDSIKQKQICSDKCLQKEFSVYLGSSSDTKYIEIERI